MESSFPDELGHARMGIGAWSWGDRLFWGYGREYADADIRQAFETSLAAGIRFFDTAESYGQGHSEQILGQLLKTTSVHPLVATKFMPYPWRLSGGTLIKALHRSLVRLDLPAIDLYQIHWPYPPVSTDTWMDAMAQAVRQGLVRYVGVSNYNLPQTRKAMDALARHGLELASNQVEYNLINRRIERNGLLDRCREMGITVIAYSPLAQGLLTGKYNPDNPPSGVRGMRYHRRLLQEIQPLIQQMKKIGAAHDGRTPAQVAINWTICKGTFPIPGAKNTVQAQQNAGAIGWSLTEEEVAKLDDLSDTYLAQR